ncbi:hypothetical protein [Arcobacter aquimarinus]|nr:hypothetical protein [Arcobacter aquimarinus]
MTMEITLILCFAWFIAGYVAAEVAGNKRKDKNKIPFKEKK